MDYLEKTILNKYNYEDTAHVATTITITLYEFGTDPNSDFPQPARITVRGVRDKQTLINKIKPPDGITDEAIIPDVSKEDFYPLIKQRVIEVLLARPKLAGAVIKNTAEVEE